MDLMCTTIAVHTHRHYSLDVAKWSHPCRFSKNWLVAPLNAAPLESRPQTSGPSVAVRKVCTCAFQASSRVFARRRVYKGDVPNPDARKRGEASRASLTSKAKPKRRRDQSGRSVCGVIVIVSSLLHIRSPAVGLCMQRGALLVSLSEPGHY